MSREPQRTLRSYRGPTSRRPIAAKSQSGLDAIVPELKAAVRDRIRYLRAIAVETIPEVFGAQNKRQPNYESANAHQSPS